MATTILTNYFIHNVFIPFHEVDRAGIMFFGHLFTYAHETYEQFMAHLEFNLDGDWDNRDYLLPIVHAEANYKIPLCHGMNISVNLSLAKIGTTSFTTSYLFLGHAGQLHANAQLVHCCIDAKTHIVKSLPDELRIKLEKTYVIQPI